MEKQTNFMSFNISPFRMEQIECTLWGVFAYQLLAYMEEYKPISYNGVTYLNG